MIGRFLVYSLFFVSGTTALVYQVAWTRNLTLIFGASHEAVAVVLGAFMAGLALGGFVCGRLAVSGHRGLALYGALEVGIAVFALCVPMLLGLADGAYVRAALAADGVSPGLHLLRVALSFAVLLLPTFLMGGTLPVLVRFLVESTEQLGERLSTLYAVNTAGAVAGTVAATFFLLPGLGVGTSQQLAAAVNLVVGLGALWLGRGERLRDASATREARPEAPAVDEHEASPVATAALRLSFLGTVVAGSCALALEVMWMRAISISTGSTAYSFGTMLATFLAGIAMGSWLYTILPVRRLGAATKFGAAMVATGTTVALATAAIPRLPYLAILANDALYADSGGLRTGTTLALSVAVMLLPCVFMGMTFPLAGEARAALSGDVGESTGDLVGLNTLGAIAGSLAAGFVLIPRLGLEYSMLLTAGLYAAYGVLVLGAVASHRARQRRSGVRAVAVAAAVLALVAPLALPRWDVRILAAYRNNVAAPENDDREERLRRYLEGTTVLYYHEGAAANVSVVESGGHRALLVDGKVVASDRTADMYHELLLGTLPALLHPDPKSAVVVGLGAGVTLGGVLDHPSVERVVVVEIEPGVVDAARLFSHVNGAALEDPRLEVAFQDGRNYLRTTTEKFDVVTADPIHPWARGAAYLYTTEYYRMLGEHLNEGGVMCQWLPLYELSLDDIRSVMATFADNFEHSTVWQTSLDVVLIGSHDPLRVDLDDLSRRFEEPRVRRPLTQIGLGDPLALLADLTIDSKGLADFTAGAVRNTDDNLYLEFSSPLSSGNPRFYDNVRAVNRARETLVSPLVAYPEGVSWSDYRRAKSETMEAEIAFEEARFEGTAAAYRPLIEDLDRIIAHAPQPGRARYVASMARIGLGQVLLRTEQTQEALAVFEEAVTTMPELAEARFWLATLLLQQGRSADALPHLEIALSEQPTHARARLAYGLVLKRTGRVEEATRAFREAAHARPLFAEAHYRLALELAHAGSVEPALGHFETAWALEPKLTGLHANYAAFLAGQHRSADAIAVLRRGVRADPTNWHLASQLAWMLVSVPEESLRDLGEAKALVQRARASVDGEQPQILDVEAAILAAQGQFEEASRRAAHAADLLRERGDSRLEEQVRRRALLYQQGKQH